jgi:hypothetical protein
MKTKQWYQSKTIWVQIITMLIGAVTIVSASDAISTQNALILATIVVPILNMFLRTITSEPITGKKDPK